MNGQRPVADLNERRSRRPDNCRENTRKTCLIALARLVLSWERLWPKVWPLAGVCGLFLAIALFDVLPHLPTALHMVVLGVFVAGVLWAINHAMRGGDRIGRANALKRVERDSKLLHRPLAGLEDTLALGDQALWQEHQRRTAQRIAGRLNLRFPSPQLARHDPFALRALIILLIIIGSVVGGSEGSQDAGDRLLRAISPGRLGGDLVARVDIWVTPPDYTRSTPFHLFYHGTEDAAEFDMVRSIPYGSIVLAQVTTQGTPVLTLGNREEPFHSLGVGGFRVETKVIASDIVTDQISRLGVSFGGETRTSWPVRLLGDKPPVVWFDEPPRDGGRGRLHIALVADDDYGLRDATLVIRNPAIAPETPQGNSDRLGLPLPRANAMKVNTSLVQDLSAHDWAGKPVELRLEVSDGTGQIARSENVKFVLPERIFNHPVARTLIETRKKLMEPIQFQVIGSLMSELDAVSDHPDQFENDTVAYLAIRVARARLSHDLSPAGHKSVRDILWKTAVRIEDGELALASQRLFQLQDDLMKALRDGGYDDLLNEMLDALNQALDRFITALMDRMIEKGLDELSDLPGMPYLNDYDLKNMIEDARNLARQGLLGAAEDSLQELRSILENIEAAMSSDFPLNEFAEMRKMMDDLGALTYSQENLLDDTFRQMRRLRGLDENAGNFSPSNISPEQAIRNFSTIQEGLRQQLLGMVPGLREFFGSMPQSLTAAEDSMMKASENLAIGDARSAMPYQGHALEALRKMVEDMAGEIASQLRAMPGAMPSIHGTLPTFGEDPFGRSGGGGIGSQIENGPVQIPDQMEIRRIHEIRDELRNRLTQPNRPELEREYIRRLLQQF